MTDQEIAAQIVDRWREEADAKVSFYAARQLVEAIASTLAAKNAERDEALNERNAARRVAEDRYQHGWDDAMLAIKGSSVAPDTPTIRSEVEQDLLLIATMAYLEAEVASLRASLARVEQEKQDLEAQAQTAYRVFKAEQDAADARAVQLEQETATLARECRAAFQRGVQDEQERFRATLTTLAATMHAFAVERTRQGDVAFGEQVRQFAAELEALTAEPQPGLTTAVD